MNSMKLFETVGALFATVYAYGTKPETAAEAADHEARVAITKGIDWIRASQHQDGTWSEANMPALTGLPLWALARSGCKDCETNITRAVAFLLKCQNVDGGIYVANPDRKGGGLGNYNTCVCMAALYATGRPELLPAILKARTYVAASQHLGDDMHNGGFGYDATAKRPYTDLNNTAFALDAMRYTQGAEDARPAGEKHADLNWTAALDYVSKMQVNDGLTAGGFTYNRISPKGGTETNAQGKITFRAYGSMTYAGMLSMLHANLSPGDPRVRAALDYASRFWTVTENPGQGQQGLYFYLNVMARALSTARLQTLQQPTTTIYWRHEMIRQLAKLQNPDGSWRNANNRWWENDPVLATAYAILALEDAARSSGEPSVAPSRHP